MKCPKCTSVMVWDGVEEIFYCLSCGTRLTKEGTSPYEGKGTRLFGVKPRGGPKKR